MGWLKEEEERETIMTAVYITSLLHIHSLSPEIQRLGSQQARQLQRAIARPTEIGQAGPIRTSMPLLSPPHSQTPNEQNLIDQEKQGHKKTKSPNELQAAQPMTSADGGASGEGYASGPHSRWHLAGRSQGRCVVHKLLSSSSGLAF